MVLIFMVNSCVPKYEMDALENRRVCEEYLAGGNRLSITWQNCQQIYNEAMAKGKENARNKSNIK